MNRNLSNAAYGVLDYVSYPVGMLLVAPIVLHRLGAADYGLWMISTSIVSAGGIIASGFCDVGIQQIASLRSENAAEPLKAAVNTLLAINISVGSALAFLVWFAAPYATSRFAAGHILSPQECIACLKIASAAILIRAIETVPVCAQRAFEKYGGTTRISVAIRLFTLGAAAAIAAWGGRATHIMLFTTALLGVGTFLQFHCLHRYLDIRNIKPDFRFHRAGRLLHSGFFVWLQALGSVLFRQFDRIALGLALGASSVVPYSMSIQISEPLFGLTASCLSFFFPYLSRSVGLLSQSALRRTVLKVFFYNFLLVLSGAALLLLCGSRLMRAWAGTSVEHSAHTLLPLVIVGSALSGLSVVGTYTAQALGMFRTVACISLASRSGLLILMLFLLQHRGLMGLAFARVCYGAAALLVYWPIARQLGFLGKEHTVTLNIPLATELQEEGQI